MKVKFSVKNFAKLYNIGGVLEDQKFRICPDLHFDLRFVDKVKVEENSFNFQTVEILSILHQNAFFLHILKLHKNSFGTY